jgi:hypothetical protein
VGVEAAIGNQETKKRNKENKAKGNERAVTVPNPLIKGFC